MAPLLIVFAALRGRGSYRGGYVSKDFKAIVQGNSDEDTRVSAHEEGKTAQGTILCNGQACYFSEVDAGGRERRIGDRRGMQVRHVL